MQQPVRYYIQTRGEQPTVRSVPVARQRQALHCAAAPAHQAADPVVASPVKVPAGSEPRRASGVARLRAALSRGAR